MKNRSRPIPSKHIIFHAWMLIVVGGTAIALLDKSNKLPSVSTIICIITAIAVYWAIELMVLRRGITKRLWRNHVLNPEVNRISIAVLVRAIELGFVFIMFIGWFLIAGNLIFDETGSTSTSDWLRAILHAVQSAGLQTNRQYHAPGVIGIMLTALSSLAGLILAGVWVAIFLSDFTLVFGKGESLIQRRVAFRSGRLRTSRLSRTRRHR
jgi:hypothetical protein